MKKVPYKALGLATMSVLGLIYFTITKTHITYLLFNSIDAYIANHNITDMMDDRFFSYAEAMTKMEDMAPLVNLPFSVTIFMLYGAFCGSFYQDMVLSNATEKTNVGKPKGLLIPLVIYGVLHILPIWLTVTHMVFQPIVFGFIVGYASRLFLAQKVLKPTYTVLGRKLSGRLAWTVLSIILSLLWLLTV